METLEVKVTGETQTLTVLQGSALPLKEPVKRAITGDIKAVSAFAALRRSNNVHEFQTIVPGVSIVFADKDKGTIKLLTVPGNHYGTEVTGSLELSEQLKKFRINESKLMTQKEVVDILRFNRIYFKDKDRAEVVLKAYQAFTYSANATGKSESDTRGNKQNNFTKTVETSLPDDFVLQIPIFKGEAEKTFRVEICLDVTDGGAKFWFESVELHEIIELEKELIFERELKSCAGLVIINK